MANQLKFVPLVALLVVVVLVTVTQAIDEIAFYQHPVCNGHHYAMTLGRGECKTVPDWLTEEGWNLSVDPRGHCIKVYDNPGCRESTLSVVGYAYNPNARQEVVRRCKSTKQLGFTTIRSFKRVSC